MKFPRTPRGLKAAKIFFLVIVSALLVIEIALAVDLAVGAAHKIRALLEAMTVLVLLIQPQVAFAMTFLRALKSQAKTANAESVGLPWSGRR